MGFFSRIFGRSDRAETRAADYLPSQFGSFMSGGYNDTGVTVTESNAMICSAVWSCVSIISQTISTLPLHVIRRDDGEKEYDHPIARLMGTMPNPYMSPAVFREVLLTNALLYGGSAAVITRDSLGQPDAFYPLRSSDVRPVRRGGQLIYEARVGSTLYELTPDQVLYLLGWSMDGITPISPIRSGTQAVALSIAMERYAGKAFGGANIGGILQTPKMSDEAMKSFVESWRKNYSGLDAAFKVAMLPDPMKFTPTTLNPETAQMTQARQNQVLEVARYYKVPPHMLGLMDKGSSYSSIEQANMNFYQQCISPWCVKLEQELSIKGLLERERPEYEIRHNLDSLLRSDTSARYTAYQTGRQGGWLSINDVRRKENLPPIEGGDEFLTPLNMAPVGPPGTLPPTPTTPPAPQPDPNPATRALIEDAARRLLTKESRAIAKAAKKHAGQPEQFRSWAAEWYGRHEQLVVRTLAASFLAAGLAGTESDYAKKHCDESRAAVVAAFDAGTVDDLTDEFETVRPGVVADELTKAG